MGDGGEDVETSKVDVHISGSGCNGDETSIVTPRAALHVAFVFDGDRRANLLPLFHLSQVVDLDTASIFTESFKIHLQNDNSLL